jgi:hypothetical protein
MLLYLPHAWRWQMHRYGRSIEAETSRLQLGAFSETILTLALEVELECRAQKKSATETVNAEQAQPGQSGTTDHVASII